jgi:hypothetical protein
LSVTVWGSGSCPYMPTKFRIMSPRRLFVRVEPDATPTQVCTADLRPTTSDLQFDPAKARVAPDVRVTFRFAGEATPRSVSVRARVLSR